MSYQIQGSTGQDINVMSDMGINWVSVNDMSDAGINWLDIDVMSDAGMNWVRHRCDMSDTRVSTGWIWMSFQTQGSTGMIIDCVKRYGDVTGRR